MTACPDKRLLLNALVDGELDAANALSAEAHAAACAGCAAELERLRASRTLLATPGLAYAPPPGFEERLMRTLDAEAAPPRRRAARPMLWFGGGAGVSIAAAIALFALVSPVDPTLSRDLVDGHVRSLQAQHLVDVATSDRHTVKPWFNGRIDFAPKVVDLAPQGFPLAGGRLDYLHGRTVAALVFRRRAHVINLFVWPGRAPGAATVERRDGYTLVRWSRDGLVYWAVSDVDPADLAAFQAAFDAAR